MRAKNLRILYFFLISVILAAACTKNDTTEAEPNSTLTNGLLAYYPFTGNANDSSENGYHAFNNGPTLIADRFGRANSAYSFDGIDDTVSIPPIMKAKDLTTFSISVWVNPEVTVGFRSIIDMTNNGIGNHTMNLFYSGSEISNYNSIGDCIVLPLSTSCGAHIISQKTNQASRKWSHIVFSRETDSIHCYFDGKENVNANKLLREVKISFTNGGRIGGVYGPYGFFHGAIDDVRIYNRMLTAAEVTELFEERP